MLYIGMLVFVFDEVNAKWLIEVFLGNCHYLFGHGGGKKPRPLFLGSA